MKGISISDVMMIVAVLVAPFCAVFIQNKLEEKKEKRKRKLDIFTILMATRAARLSFDHVRALNMIDIEFYGIKKVINAWQAYNHHLNSKVSGEHWGTKQIELFIELLYEIAKELGYSSLNKTELENRAYSPIAHGNLEDNQLKINENLLAVLQGKQPLIVRPDITTNYQKNPETEKENVYNK